MFDFLPSLPSLSEVGEVGIGLPGMPSIPSLPSIPDLPSLPSISEVGEISVGLPSLPTLPALPGVPSISEVGEIAVRPDQLPNLPNLPSLQNHGPIAEVGEIGVVHAPEPATTSTTPGMHKAGLVEAERGLDRADRGENVVGRAGDTGFWGEDGTDANEAFLDDPAAQEFGRLHDIEAAIAEAEYGGAANDDLFTIANGLSAVVGLGATRATSSALTFFGAEETAREHSGEVGAAMANGVFGLLGYSTGDYADIAREAGATHRPG